MTLCPVCSLYEARRHPTLGILPCENCQIRRSDLKSPDHLVEFTSTNIKKERIEYNKDITQPFRGNEPSKEFIDAYPEKAKKMFTQREIRMAKKVWN